MIGNGSLSETVESSFVNIYGTRSAVHIPCTGKGSFQQVMEITNKFKHRTNSYSLQIEENDDAECGWKNPAHSCNFIKELIQAYKFGQYKVDNQSTKQAWTKIFGGPNACNMAGSNVNPTGYFNLTGSVSFEDFEPFGGWTTPGFKIFYYDKSICGTAVYYYMN